MSNSLEMPWLRAWRHSRCRSNITSSLSSLHSEHFALFGDCWPAKAIGVGWEPPAKTQGATLEGHPEFAQPNYRRARERLCTSTIHLSRRIILFFFCRRSRLLFKSCGAGLPTLLLI